jgi:hypothetical protein
VQRDIKDPKWVAAGKKQKNHEKKKKKKEKLKSNKQSSEDDDWMDEKRKIICKKSSMDYGNGRKTRMGLFPLLLFRAQNLRFLIIYSI